jgi:hypothetical protein
VTGSSRLCLPGRGKPGVGGGAGVLGEVVGDAYFRMDDPYRVLRLICKFSRGGSSMIPQGRRFEFLKQLAALR